MENPREGLIIDPHRFEDKKTGDITNELRYKDASGQVIIADGSITAGPSQGLAWTKGTVAQLDTPLEAINAMGIISRMQNVELIRWGITVAGCQNPDQPKAGDAWCHLSVELETAPTTPHQGKNFMTPEGRAEIDQQQDVVGSERRPDGELWVTLSTLVPSPAMIIRTIGVDSGARKGKVWEERTLINPSSAVADPFIMTSVVTSEGTISNLRVNKITRDLELSTKETEAGKSANPKRAYLELTGVCEAYQKPTA